MSKNSVFSGVENLNPFKSNLPNIDFKEFEKVINTRRSVRVFKKDIIPIKVVKKCLENALKAPTSSNLQTWEIYWIRNKEKKKGLSKHVYLNLLLLQQKNCLFLFHDLTYGKEIIN